MYETEIPWRDPLDAFEATRGDRFAILFHGGAVDHAARWSFIAAAPESIVRGTENGVSGFEALKAAFASRRRRPPAACGAPFAGGLAGFAGYEALRWREPSVAPPASPYSIPDFLFGEFSAIAAFDQAAGKSFLLGNNAAAIDRLGAALADAPPAEATAQVRVEVEPMDAQAYVAAVGRVVERIRAGDLFQANLSHRILARAYGATSAYGFFRAACARGAGAFSAFIRADGAEIMSLSPERFIRIDAARRITAEPIKGTRPRGRTAAEDAAHLQSLVSDPKDRAENIMIADLTRNDLSAICRDGSMREDAICEPMTAPSVHHLVSRISADLAEGVNAVDALYSMFPCGSITGAPKVEAMRVIAELEGVGRGPYCGAIGYVDDSGAADFSVAIRTAAAERAVGSLNIHYRVGAGVTLRSEPWTEYRETLDKARAFLDAMGVDAGSIE